MLSSWKSCLASTKAAMEAMIRCPAVPTPVINTVLNRYRRECHSGFAHCYEQIREVISVGFCANIHGGNINNSSKGFKALLTAYTIGNTITIAFTSNRKKYKRISPHTERFGFLLLISFCVVLLFYPYYSYFYSYQVTLLNRL